MLSCRHLSVQVQLQFDRSSISRRSSKGLSFVNSISTTSNDTTPITVTTLAGDQMDRRLDREYLLACPPKYLTTIRPSVSLTTGR